MSFSKAKAIEFLKTSHEKIAELTAHSRKLKDLSNYHDIRTSIESLGRKIYRRDVEVHFFGSRILGLGTDSSDLDIYVDIGDKYYSTYKVSQEHDENYRKLVKALNESNDWDLKKDIINTAVPIIIAEYKPLAIHCDINITNGLGPANSKLLGYLFDIQPEAVPMVHFIKSWLSSQGFSGIRGYPLTLLVLFYLQTNKLMPTIMRVQSDPDIAKEIIGGWEVQFNSARSLESYMSFPIFNHRSLIKNFFKQYMTFTFDRLIISPYCGLPLDRFDYVKKHEDTYSSGGLNIADPINHGKNDGLCEGSVKYEFINLCKESAAFLDTIEPL